MKKNPQVLIFDSGVGGLSIVKALREEPFVTPAMDITFVSDNAYFPYGTKTDQQLKDRVNHLFAQLIPALQPDVVIVACNSASTIVLPSLRRAFDLPIIGVVPAIKPAAQLSKTQSIALLATPATVQRAYTSQLIDDFASNCQLLKIGSSELVDIAEQKLRTGQVDITRLAEIIEPIFCQPTAVDVVVLACTHFPLLIDELQQIEKEKRRKKSANPQPAINWLDSSAAISRRLQQILTQNKLLVEPRESHPNTHRLILASNAFNGDSFSGNQGAAELLSAYGQFGFTDFEIKSW